MCGITACAAPIGVDVLDTLVDGLRNLEYRGYDASGVTVRENEAVTVVKREGEIDALVDALGAIGPTDTIGTGHSRWSTHDAPTDVNAHPHTGCRDRVSVVHNGIVENYATLREELIERGHTFTSETDTEVAPQFVEEYLKQGHSTESAFRVAAERLEGRFAAAMVVAVEDDERRRIEVTIGWPPLGNRSRRTEQFGMVPPRTIAFTPEDEGKRVVTTSGDVVGEIARTEDGTAFVRPSRELVACYGSRITGCLDPDERLPLDGSAVTVDGDGRVQIDPEGRPEPGTVQPAERVAGSSRRRVGPASGAAGPTEG